MISIVTKRCPSCKDTKDSSLFNKKGKGLSSYCKECTKLKSKEWKKPTPKANRNYRLKYLTTKDPEHLVPLQAARRKRYRTNSPDKARASDFRQDLRKYDLTPDEFGTLEQEQNFVCAICGEKNQNTRRLCVDHDHAVEGPVHVRGLLCHRCNVMLGMALDNPDILLKAIAYLERTKRTPSEIAVEYEIAA